MEVCRIWGFRKGSRINLSRLSPERPTLPRMGKLEDGFTAQYASGTCTGCGGEIEAGQEIANSGYGGRVTRYHHVRCPGASITCSICGGEWFECDCP